jgi:hypothetical protein
MKLKPVWEGVQSRSFSDSYTSWLGWVDWPRGGKASSIFSGASPERRSWAIRVKTVKPTDWFWFAWFSSSEPLDNNAAMNAALATR